MKYYQQPALQNWQGRTDSQVHERLFQSIRLIDLQNKLPPTQNKKSYSFVGFCCDEGIKRNLGRVGAKEGPKALRSMLSNLSLAHLEETIFYDVGDIVCHESLLEEAQRELAEVVSICLKQSITPIVLGGGHETAWGHYQGINLSNPHLNVGIINFDAHFDMRPLLQNNQGTSGTPFLQIAHQRQQNNKSFNYFCIGIQSSANTQSLFNTAEQFNVNYILADSIHQQQLHMNQLEKFIEKVDALYVTFCLDVMAQAVAPGVSAPQAFGLFPQQILPYIKTIVTSKKMLSLDVVELSPPLDRDNQTAKLAAQIIYNFLVGLERHDATTP